MARILVIEDNPVNLELMRYLLTAFGHDVQIAGDGGEGIVAVRRDMPELIVCDVHLPKIDGYEVARQLKSDAKLKGIPLIAVTALAMVGDRERGLAAGFDGYVYKPIEPETFVTEIERFLQMDSRGEAPVPVLGNASNHAAPPVALNISVLVVDDSQVNRDLMRDLLEPFGYEVRLASNVAEAMSASNLAIPDLIISDLHMPEADGFSLIRQIKAVPLLAQIPLIIISSTAWGGKDREIAEKLGAARFFLRPIEPQVLLNEIHACLQENRR